MQRRRRTPYPFRFQGPATPKPFHRKRPATVTPRCSRGPVVATWICPVCDHPAHRHSGPGRPPVYCSNACRQWAYRWRRQHCVRLFADFEHRADRGNTGARTHAIRDDRDPIHGRKNSRGRTVSVCGSFVWAASERRNALHDEYLPELDGNSCKTCSKLIGVAPPDRLTAFEARCRWQLEVGAGIWQHSAQQGLDQAAAIRRLDPIPAYLIDRLTGAAA